MAILRNISIEWVYFCNVVIGFIFAMLLLPRSMHALEWRDIGNSLEKSDATCFRLHVV